MPIGAYIDKLNVDHHVKKAMDYLQLPYNTSLKGESKYYYLSLGLWLENNG